MRLKLWPFFFQRPAECYRGDRLAGLFLKASLQGSNLMWMLGHQRLQSLVIVFIKGGGSPTTRLVDEPVEAGHFPLLEPSRNGIAANLQYFTDLVNRVALLTQ